jgi:hypothetical protein
MPFGDWLVANGPAIKGGCSANWRTTPAPPDPPAGGIPVGHKTIPVQGGYGASFAVMVQSWLARAASRYKPI